MSTVQASALVAMVGQSAAAVQSGARQAAHQATSATPVQKVVASAVVEKPAAVREPPPQVDPARMRERLEKVVDELNSMIKSGNRDLAFGVDQVADRFVVTVKNSNDGEVVRQIPGEDVLRIAHRMEALKGLLFEDLF